MGILLGGVAFLIAAALQLLLTLTVKQQGAPAYKVAISWLLTFVFLALGFYCLGVAYAN
jgi:hypothetical protein